MATKKKALQAAAGAAGGGAELLAIEDVFSTYLYTGNGSTQTITNGIDLAGEGGMVWLKDRDRVISSRLIDTERGATKNLISSSTTAEITQSTVTSFNSDGFSLGNEGATNEATYKNASWSFRKAPRWFDVVTWTGDGTSNRAIPHNLGTTVGTIIIKCTSTAATDWVVWHRSLGATDFLRLNLTNAATTDSSKFSQAPTDTQFYVGNDGRVNVSGRTYVAYLFAHDPLGPSGDGSDGLIACGSYTGTGAAIDIDLGWEPQWVMVKNASATNNWLIVDNMRGAATGGSDAVLFANTSGTESSFNEIDFTSTGFRENNSVNSGNTYIYIAIRRGPMRTPTSGTEVFAPVFGDGSGTPSIKTSFPVDLGMVTNRASGGGTLVGSRMTGAVQLNTSSTNAESSNSFFEFDFQNGWHTWTGINSGYINWNFRRAPGFFDVVAYGSDNTTSQTISHNLTVTPEMFIVKVRDTTAVWGVYHKDVGNTAILRLNSIGGPLTGVDYLNNTSPTETDFTVGTYFNGQVGHPTKYIAYLFATVPGVSKVGSYTGNGTSQTIDCGFTSGARFVLIKRTDTAGFNWYLFDTERGIVSGNDPALTPNTTDAEVSIWDMVDPDASGFAVTSDAKVNGSGGNFIFLAIA